MRCIDEVVTGENRRKKEPGAIAKEFCVLLLLLHLCNELIGWMIISIDSYEELFSRYYPICLVSNVESKMMINLVFSANKSKNKLKFLDHQIMKVVGKQAASL